MTKLQYLAQEGKNKENKTTFFSPTFKIEEKKVVLFFRIEASQARYSIFVIFSNSEKIHPFPKKTAILNRVVFKTQDSFFIESLCISLQKKTVLAFGTSWAQRLSFLGNWVFFSENQASIKISIKIAQNNVFKTFFLQILTKNT